MIQLRKQLMKALRRSITENRREEVSLKLKALMNHQIHYQLPVIDELQSRLCFIDELMTEKLSASLLNLVLFKGIEIGQQRSPSIVELIFQNQLPWNQSDVIALLKEVIEVAGISKCKLVHISAI